MNSKLKNNSNYYLIILYFTLDMILQNLKQQHSWKKMNKEDIVANTQYLHMSKLLNELQRSSMQFSKCVQHVVKRD